MRLKELKRVIFDNICVYEISKQQGSKWTDLYTGKADALPQELDDRIVKGVSVFHDGVLNIMVDW